MKITRTVENRKISLAELVLLKDTDYFGKWRALGKMTNFLTIFGGSPKVFYTGVLETNWSHQEIKAYIKIEGLHDLVDTMQDKYSRDSGEVIDYPAVASHMISTFFKNYTGLMERISRNRAFAKEHGYLRYIYGGTRVLPELMLAGKYDQKENGKILRNLANIAANADIQNFESCIINTAMVRAEKTLQEKGIDAEMFNNIHDSTDFYVKKTDLDEFAKVVNEEFTRDFPEFEGIPLPIDFNVVDKTRGENYKHGANYYI